MADELRSIVKRVLAGDVDAFEGVIDRYQRELWMVVACYLRNRTLIAEIVDTTFVKAYFALEHFDLERDFAAWIHTIARNEVKMHLRRQLSEKAANACYLDRLNADAAMDELERERAEEMKDDLADCLEKLPEDQRGMIVARYQRDLPLAKIAEEFNRSLEAVKKRLSRIRTQLRICIERKAAQRAN